MDQGYVLYKIVLLKEQKKLEKQLEFKQAHIEDKKDELAELLAKHRRRIVDACASNSPVTAAARRVMAEEKVKLENLIDKHERGKVKVVEKIKKHDKPKMHYRFMEEYLVALQARGKAWLETDDGAAAKEDLRDRRFGRRGEGGEGGGGREEREKKILKKGEKKLTLETMHEHEYRLHGIHALVKGAKCSTDCDYPGCPNMHTKCVKIKPKDGTQSRKEYPVKCRAQNDLMCRLCKMGFCFECWNLWHGLE
jgi:hypothetical protein